MLELIVIVLVILWLVRGSGSSWPVYHRGGLLTVILVIFVLWFLLGPHSPRYLY
jgi:hypothetical protein